MRDRFPHPYSETDAEGFIAFCEQMTPRTYFAITVDEEAVGGIGITLHGDVERVAAELGYWLGESHWGRGIVTEAVTALTEWAFRELPLTRVYALPLASNPASARVLEKAGLRLEGQFRQAVLAKGHWVRGFGSASTSASE